MGYTQAAGFAEAVSEGWCDLGIALHWHLTSNHYPPLPACTLLLAKQALNHAARDEWDAVVDVSSIGTHRVHGVKVPAHVLIQDWHLEHFIGVAKQALDEEE